jgi:hypothetical protein
VRRRKYKKEEGEKEVDLKQKLEKKLKEYPFL